MRTQVRCRCGHILASHASGKNRYRASRTSSDVYTGANLRRERLVGGFIQDRQRLVTPPVAEFVVEDADALHVIGVSRSRPELKRQAIDPADQS